MGTFINDPVEALAHRATEAKRLLALADGRANPAYADALVSAGYPPCVRQPEPCRTRLQWQW